MGACDHSLPNAVLWLFRYIPKTCVTVIFISFLHSSQIVVVRWRGGILPGFVASVTANYWRSISRYSKCVSLQLLYPSSVVINIWHFMINDIFEVSSLVPTVEYSLTPLTLSIRLYPLLWGKGFLHWKPVSVETLKACNSFSFWS